MLRWWTNWFNNKSPEPDDPSSAPVEPGQIWQFSPDLDDPWPNNNPTVTIYDVKNGWVRFGYGKRSIHDDERMKISIFIELFKQIQKEAE